VFAPAFIDHKTIDDTGCVTMSDGSTINDLYNLLHLPIPLRLSYFCNINYEPAKKNTPLKDGDTVSFLFPISGG